MRPTPTLPPKGPLISDNAKGCTSCLVVLVLLIAAGWGIVSFVLERRTEQKRAAEYAELMRQQMEEEEEEREAKAKEDEILRGMVNHLLPLIDEKYQGSKAVFGPTVILEHPREASPPYEAIPDSPGWGGGLNFVHAPRSHPYMGGRILNYWLRDRERYGDPLIIRPDPKSYRSAVLVKQVDTRVGSYLGAGGSYKTTLTAYVFSWPEKKLCMIHEFHGDPPESIRVPIGFGGSANGYGDAIEKLSKWCDELPKG